MAFKDEKYRYVIYTLNVMEKGNQKKYATIPLSFESYTAISRSDSEPILRTR
jgi:hypothetical protein